MTAHCSGASRARRNRGRQRRPRRRPFRPTEKSWPAIGMGTPAGAFRRRDREGIGPHYRALGWHTARWRFHPMEERSRPPETDSPFTSGIWRRARTAWRLPKRIRAASRLWHSRRRQDARLRQRRPDRPDLGPGDGATDENASPWTAGSGRSRSPPMGRSSPPATSYPERGKCDVWNLKTGERLHTWPIAEATIRAFYAV